jgi:hypothetical protein
MEEKPFPSLTALVVALSLGAIPFAHPVSAPMLTPEDSVQAYVGSEDRVIELGPNSRMIIERRGHRIEYGPGERIHMNWRDGVIYVEDQQIDPWPERRKEIPLETLKRLCAGAPFVQAHLEEHRGQASDEELWREAAELWFAQREATYDEADQLYSRLLRGEPGAERRTLNPDEAIERVAEALRRKTDLVDSVVVVPTPISQDSVRFIDLYWKGQPYGPMSIGLTPQVPRRPRPGPRLVSRGEFETRYWGYAQILSGTNGRRTITLKDGTVGIDIEGLPTVEGDRP